MRASRHAADGGRLLVLLACGLFACRTAPPPDGEPQIGASELVEQAHDGEHVLPRGKVASADPRSDLVLSFGQRAATERLERRATELTTALETAQRLMARRRELLERFARVDAGDAAAVAELQATSRSFNTDVLELVQGVRALGVSDEQLRAAGNGFAALVALLARRVEREERELAARRARDQWEVTVRAHLEPRGKQAKYLHVPGYDDLDDGEMESRYGKFLGISKDELRDLAENLRATEEAAQLVRDTIAEAKQGKQAVAALVEGLRTALEGFLAHLPPRPETAVDELIAKLEPLRGAAEAGVQAQAAAALEVLGAWKEQIAALRALAARWEALRAQLTSASTLPLSSLVSKQGALYLAIQDTANGLATLVDAAPRWPAQADTLSVSLAGLASAAPEAVLPPELLAFFRQLETAWAPVAEKLARFRALVELGAKAAQDADATASVAPADPPQGLYHPLDTAPEARVRLGRTDVSEGDRVHVEAVAYPPGSDRSATAPGRVVETWEADVERFGFYARVSPQLIFARADSGSDDARSWKPNAAALADLHHRFRFPSRAGELWNAIDPALGVHLASLDQDDDTVEFGLGVNLSFFGGFVTAGYGQNLARDGNRGYYFVGIGLLNVLQEAQKLGTP